MKLIDLIISSCLHLLNLSTFRCCHVHLEAGGLNEGVLVVPKSEIEHSIF